MNPYKTTFINLAHNWYFLLLLMTVFAIIIRALPAIMNAAWGVDFGIYYGLTNSFVETKTLYNPYTGWGDSYQYFPALYAITGIAHWITGIEIIHLLPKIAPIFGGLTIPILGFIVYELFKDKRVALISALLLSTATFHVYQTSHAAPLTIGHFFMMISLFFLIKSLQKPTYILPLTVSTVLLIFSHHFTTYFYLISITIMLMYYTLIQSKNQRTSWFFLLYVLSTASLSFAYWAFIATPVYDTFMNRFLFLPSYALILLYFMFTLTGFFLGHHIYHLRTAIPRPLKKISASSLPKKIMFACISLLTLSIFACFTGIPGVHVMLTPLAIAYSLPMIVLAGFSYAGFNLLLNRSHGALIKGWIYALIGSFLIAIITASLLPDRHLEYIIVPLCIPAALCINQLLLTYSKTDVKQLFTPSRSLRGTIQHHFRSISLIITVAVLVIANTIVAYPTIEALNTLDERVSDPCMNTLEWMKGNISNASIIASDHRLSMLCWAEGFFITYGSTNQTWTEEDLHGCFSELYQHNITHVLVDDIMTSKVVNVNVGKYFYMTNGSYDKFQQPPFTLLYRNASYNDQHEEVHWAELYEINYSTVLKSIHQPQFFMYSY